MTQRSGFWKGASAGFIIFSSKWSNQAKKGGITEKIFEIYSQNVANLGDCRKCTNLFFQKGTKRGVPGEGPSPLVSNRELV